MPVVARAALGAALIATAACASVSHPPGGPEDHDPPVIVAVSIDTNQTAVHDKQIEIRFDEVVAEAPVGTSSGPGAAGRGRPTLDAVVVLSPRTGQPRVRWHRDRITIEPRGGFAPNTAYRLTILAGIADIRGNVQKEATSLIFSTGASIPPYSILGTAFDWASQAPANGAAVEAVANPGTKDSLVYVGYADSTGRFDVGPLTPGKYLVRGYLDADNDRALSGPEKWDTTTVTITDHRPVVELKVIQRDTMPVGIARVEVLDSAWIRLRLDKPFDAQTVLQPAFILIRASDSSDVTVGAVMFEATAAKLRGKPDSTKSSAPAAANPVTTATDTRPPEAKPSAPPPETTLIIQLAQGVSLKPGASYSITIRGLRNLVGKSGPRRFQFTYNPPKPKTGG